MLVLIPSNPVHPVKSSQPFAVAQRKKTALEHRSTEEGHVSRTVGASVRDRHYASDASGERGRLNVKKPRSNRGSRAAIGAPA